MLVNSRIVFTGDSGSDELPDSEESRDDFDVSVVSLWTFEVNHLASLLLLPSVA